MANIKKFFLTNYCCPELEEELPRRDVILNQARKNAECKAYFFHVVFDLLKLVDLARICLDYCEPTEPVFTWSIRGEFTNEVISLKAEDLTIRKSNYSFFAVWKPALAFSMKRSHFNCNTPLPPSKRIMYFEFSVSIPFTEYSFKQSAKYKFRLRENKDGIDYLNLMNPHYSAEPTGAEIICRSYKFALDILEISFPVIREDEN